MGSARTRSPAVAGKVRKASIEQRLAEGRAHAVHVPRGKAPRQTGRGHGARGHAEDADGQVQDAECVGEPGDRPRLVGREVAVHEDVDLHGREADGGRGHQAADAANARVAGAHSGR